MRKLQMINFNKKQLFFNKKKRKKQLMVSVGQICDIMLHLEAIN